MEKHHEGIIILSGYVQGIVGKLLLTNSIKEAIEAALKFQNLVGNRFYFEIMRHGTAQERQIELQYLNIAKQLKIPLLATNQVLFSDISMHDSHDVLLCISQGVVRDEQNRRRVSNQCYFKSAQEMSILFSDLPEAVQNTVHLAKRCYVMSETRPPSLPNFSDGSISEEELLRLQAKEGLELRFKQKPPTEKQQYFERLNYELDIILQNEFCRLFSDSF